VSGPISYARMDPYYEALAAEQQAQENEATGTSQSTGAPETLDAMGHALLEIVEQAAVARGVQLPARRVVYPAPIPADCEQVAVLFTEWSPTPGQDGPTICQPWRWIAPFSVAITRCTPAAPKMNKPLSSVTVEAMMAAAKLASDDAEVFLEAMTRLSEVGSDVSIVTNAPQGGMQTVEWNVPLISGGSFL